MCINCSRRVRKVLLEGPLVSGLLAFGRIVVWALWCRFLALGSADVEARHFVRLILVSQIDMQRIGFLS